MNRHILVLLFVLPLALNSQPVRGRDAVPLKPWPAPLFWQPTQEEAGVNSDNNGSIARAKVQSSTPTLVFVAITPCRIVDTRSGSGFSGAFGPPSLVGQSNRTFPIQLSPNCSIPATALAYSFNVTAVPSGPLGFLTVFPSGQPLPNASTLNDPTGLILSNAAIVTAGTQGSIDVYSNNNTDLVLDINGYYMSQSAIVLSQGTASAPALSFTGDTGTGISSSGAGFINFSALGTNTLTLQPNGDLNITGNIRKNGSLFVSNPGTENTAVGLQALNSGQGGSATAVGFQALFNSAGGLNTAVGWKSMLNSASGANFNTAVGAQSLLNNISGQYNTAVGYQAVPNNNYAYWNTGVGYFTLFNNTTGNYNTALGYTAGQNLTTGDHNLDLANAGVAADAGTIRIGDSAFHNRAFFAAIRGKTTGNADAVPVMIDSAGQLGTVNSSRGFKEDIRDMGDASARLLQLRPVTYRYQQPYTDGSKPLDYGLIAEEVAEIYPDLVVKDKDGKIETVQYQKLTPMLLNEVQKQAGHIETLEAHVAALQKTLDALLAAH